MTTEKQTAKEYWKTYSGKYYCIDRVVKSTLAVEPKGEFSTNISYYPKLVFTKLKTAKIIGRQEFAEAFSKALEILVQNGK